MEPQFEFKDIDGKDIKLRDRVFVFSQDYEVIAADYSDRVPVVLVDSNKPLPLKDVPLFIGTVYWSDEEWDKGEELRIKVEEEMGDKRGVSSFPTSFYDAYQLAPE